MTRPRTEIRPGSVPTLVGRATELAALAAVLGRPPAVAMVGGEAGIGKTRLVNELPARPELAGLRFVVGGCRRIREPFPLGPVLDAVRELPDELRRARLSPVVGALRPLLPEVADLLPPQPRPPGDRDSERHQVFRALAEVLACAGPAVVVIEDMHWADAQTVDFLSYLLAHPPAGLSLVLTFRPDEVNPQVPALTARLPSSISAAHTVLPPLDEEQTGALAAAILGLDRVSDELAGP